jgi:hypothetical protein
MSQAEYQTTTKFIEVARAILEQQRPMTIRQLFYQMVGLGEDTKREMGGFGNSQKDYRRVSRMMTKARDDKRVPWDWIVDRSRPTYEPQVWGDLAGYLNSVKHSYRKDYWTNQPVHCEIWCEKDAVIGSIEDVTSDLGVVVRVGRGFQSSTRVREIASLFNRIRKPKIVFYLGDFDSSGMDIERDLRERVCRYTRPFQVRRLAIFGEDIGKFKLPPQRIKPEDPRARSFCKEHGNQCVELDALPPSELRRRVRTAVTSVIDKSAWERALTSEEVELGSIDDFVSRWPLSGCKGGEAPPSEPRQ